MRIENISEILKTNDIRHKIIVILLIINALIILRYDINPTFIRHTSDIERDDTGGNALEDTLSKTSSLRVATEFSREL
jgi:hypothetical protein